jgi:hypothetical protein
VKAILSLALLALLGFAAGCGASKKIVVTVQTGSVSIQIANNGTRTITVAGSATTTIPNVQTGTRIKCKGWPGRGVKAPAPGTTANVGGGKVTPGGAQTSHNVQLTRLANGSLTVLCTSK